MRSRWTSILAAASACVVLAAQANAQPTAAPTPEAKGQPMPQGFSVVLVLGDSQTSAIAENVPAAARRALADMKDFLPYRGYRLLDAQWILGSQRSTTRLRGVDDQEYQLSLRETAVAGGRIAVTFQLQDGTGAVTSAEVGELNARRAAEADLRARLEQLERAAERVKETGDRRAAQGIASEIEGIKQRLAANPSLTVVARGRSVIDTTFNMDIGETVVVGTSRMRGGDKALIALLTAVPKGK